MYSSKDIIYYSGLVVLCNLLIYNYDSELLDLITEHPGHSVLLAQCYIFYTFVWLFPVQLKKLFAIVQYPFGSTLTAPFFMSYIAHIMKVLQAYSVFELTHIDWKKPLDDSDWIFKIWALSLIIVGQALNSGVYNSLGVQGVYYGKRFGYPVEWVTTFPFNLNLYDPQYIGAVVSIWGFFWLFDLNGITAVFLTLCYGYMSLVEHREYTPAAETAISKSKIKSKSPKDNRKKITEQNNRKRAQTEDLSIDLKTKKDGVQTTKKIGKTTPNRRPSKKTAAY